MRALTTVYKFELSKEKKEEGGKLEDLINTGDIDSCKPNTK
jgi:hypothetical protein